MNDYTIAGYDDVNAELLVDMSYNGIDLRDRVSMIGLATVDDIKAAVAKAYEQFQATVDVRPPEVVIDLALINSMVGLTQMVEVTPAQIIKE